MIVAYGIYVLYLISLLILIIGWKSLKPTGMDDFPVPITVIVPFRNEALNLPDLVHSLSHQSHKQFEVVFVDDHSEDGSCEVLENQLQEANFQYQVLTLEGQTGKKAAIGEAIKASKNDVVITTDADCQMSKDWLIQMSGTFREESIKMAVGPVALTGKTFWQRMQSVESSALVGTSGAMIGMNRPLMSNGANLAYRKEVFKEVNGFEGIDRVPSGDDELLMHRFHQKYKGGVEFVRSSQAVVKTPALESWRQFKQQRLRWAGKWKVGKRAATIAVALFVLVVQLIQIGLLAELFSASSDNDSLTITLLLVRLFMEFIFLWSVRHSLGQRMYGLSFLMNHLLYPFYAIYFGVAANFGVFEWKGRQYQV